MRNPFKKKKFVPDPDNDPIVVTHEQDSSLDEDEIIIHTMIDPDSIPNKENDE